MAARITHIVDASAVIAYFKEEEGHATFGGLVADGENTLAIHATNLCEVYYAYLRSDGQAIADQAWEKAITILGVLDKFDSQFIKRVGRWKVEHNLPLGDAFAAATAEHQACPLITTDENHFGAISGSGALEIVWLRREPELTEAGGSL